jgi:lipoprotein-anchoring transpeptidase ErfK/SrfK
VIAFLLVLALIAVGLVGAEVLLIRVESHYQGRIYPRVYVAGVPVGGLTAEEAAAALRAAPDLSGANMLILRDGERRWAVSWSQAGIGRDLEATVQAALAMGRGELGFLARAQAWLHPYELAPLLRVDPAAARVALREVGARVLEPPVEASLHFEGDQVVAVPGKPGRGLDIDATLANLIDAVTIYGTDAQVDLVFEPVAPHVADVTPALAQAEAILERRLELSAYDVLNDVTFAWVLDRSTLVGWLRIAGAGSGDGLSVQIDPEAVRETLADLAGEMGQGRGFRIEEAVGQVLAALESGAGRVALYLTHPARTYTVVEGDTFTTIAVRFGMPTVTLAAANPRVNPDWLTVGQTLVIPSPDVLLPHMPVPGKRIVISLRRQRMHVYENGNLRHDWPVSTGLPDSPTSPGVFQVLEKVDNAFASRWSLWMPNFLAVYQAGPDFYNGIHALPIREGGGRLWEGLLGRPASYGCIILGVQEAATLYEWAELGVPVIIEP